MGPLFCLFILITLAYCDNETNVINVTHFRRYPISIISDVDQHSRRDNTYFSTMRSGTLLINDNYTEARVVWHEEREFSTLTSHEGRGMELSDLKNFNGKLLSPDDKTGIIYWLNKDKAVPFAVLSNGNGTLDSPYKCEWMTVKDEKLYCGGYGKEFTSKDGKYLNDYPFYVKKIDIFGGVRHLNWTSNFLALRKPMEINFPGYLIHESCQWSQIHRRWFFLPRHMSKLIYNSETVYNAGANVLISTSEAFDDVRLVYIGAAKTIKGFSAFQFIPGTKDRVVVALKSVEVPKKELSSYITVFDIEGNVLMNESFIENNEKYEGIEFYDMKLNQFFTASSTRMFTIGFVMALCLLELY